MRLLHFARRLRLRLFRSEVAARLKRPALGGERVAAVFPVITMTVRHPLHISPLGLSPHNGHAPARRHKARQLGRLLSLDRGDKSARPTSATSPSFPY